MKIERSWLGRIRLLPPKDRIFYAPLNGMTEKLGEASTQLIALFQSGAPAETAESIRRLETECDVHVGQIIDLLDRAQQPPYDREDLGDLAHRLDDIMDSIERAANRFVLYQLQSSDETMRDLADLIAAACRHLANAIILLPKRQGLHRHCIAVHDLEGQADDIYHRAIARRFQKIRDDLMNIAAVRGSVLPTLPLASLDEVNVALERLATLGDHNAESIRHTAFFMTLHEVYLALEAAMDACEKVAITLTRMVMTNG